MEKRARQLAIDCENVDEYEASKLRAGQHDPMQLATRESNPIRDLTGEICVDDPLVVPFVV